MEVFEVFGYNSNWSYPKQCLSSNPLLLFLYSVWSKLWMFWTLFSNSLKVQNQTKLKYNKKNPVCPSLWWTF